MILLWGAVVWGGRIALVFEAGSDPGDRLRIATAVGATLVAFAALLSGRLTRPATAFYAAVTAAVWIRSVVVVLAGRPDVGFLAVHALLAVVSLAVAAMAVLTVWQVRGP